MSNFWLGTHIAHWLRQTGVPLFVSHRRLSGRKKLPRAIGPFALDSGGFSELSMFGEWRTTPEEYSRAVGRYRDEIGNLNWAAVQDWMCEPSILAKTGLSIPEHQRRTIESYLVLMGLEPEYPWVPVLQGYSTDDYLRHFDQYAKAGIDLSQLALVGVGTLCRRQATDEAVQTLTALHGLGLKMHGFGFKLRGLRRVAHILTSSDSMAWSFDARRSPAIKGHTHKNCANCLMWALRWRKKVLKMIAATQLGDSDLRYNEKADKLRAREPSP